MGAYSRWTLIRGWALIRINTVNMDYNLTLKEGQALGGNVHVEYQLFFPERI